MVQTPANTDRNQAYSGLGNEVPRRMLCFGQVEKLNVGVCRVRQWLETAIVQARVKAVLGRSHEAHLRSVATAVEGTQLPAMVTLLIGHSDSGGALVPWGLTSPSLEKL